MHLSCGKITCEVVLVLYLRLLVSVLYPSLLVGIDVLVLELCLDLVMRSFFCQVFPEKK